jgi:phosphoadenosine phosphosulfate reductase
MNPLYAKGYKRVGCIGCPMNSKQVQEFADYPKYKENYIKAFDRMQKRNDKKGKHSEFKSGLDWYRWWIGEDPKQIRIDDIINEDL